MKLAGRTGMEDGFQQIIVHVGSMPSALCLKCNHISETVGEHVVLGRIQDPRCTTQQAFDVFDTSIAITRNVSKKSQEVHDVGRRLAALHALCVDAAANQDEEWAIEQVRLQRGACVAVESKLLIEAQERARQVELPMRRIEVLCQVQDVVIFAVSVLVKVLVGVVKQDALGILLSERLVTTC